MNMKAVKFIEVAPPYRIGDIAGFPENQANNIIKLGVAVAYSPEKKSLDKAPVDKQVKSAEVKK